MADEVLRFAVEVRNQGGAGLRAFAGDVTRASAQARRGFQGILPPLEQVERKLRAMPKSMRITLSATDRVSGTLNQIERRLHGVRRAASGAGLALGVGGGVGVGAGFIAAAKSGREFNSTLELARIAFTNILAAQDGFQGGMKRSSVVTEDLLVRMQKLADKTPFSFQQVTEGAQRLISFGVPLKDLMGTMQSLATVSAVTQNPDAINRVSLALGQMITTGRVMGTELRQLAEAGVNPYKILREELGLTKKQIANVADQNIDSLTAIRALNRGIRKQYGDVLGQAAQTRKGLESTFKDYSEQGFGLLMKPFDEWEKGALKRLNPAMKRIKARWQQNPDASIETKLKIAWEEISKTGVPGEVRDALVNGMQTVGRLAAKALWSAFKATPTWLKALIGGYGAAKLIGPAGSALRGLEQMRGIAAGRGGVGGGVGARMGGVQSVYVVNMGEGLMGGGGGAAGRRSRAQAAAVAASSFPAGALPRSTRQALIMDAAYRRGDAWGVRADPRNPAYAPYLPPPGPSRWSRVSAGASRFGAGARVAAGGAGVVGLGALAGVGVGYGVQGLARDAGVGDRASSVLGAASGGAVAGAAIGSVIPGVGTLTGAVAGAVAAGAIAGWRDFTRGPSMESQVKEASQRITKGLADGGKAAPGLDAATERLIKARAAQTKERVESFGTRDTQAPRVANAEFHVGKAAGRSVANDLQGGATYTNARSLVKRVSAVFDSLAPAARLSATRAVVAQAVAMEQAGRAPKGSADRLVKDLRSKYSELETVLPRSAAKAYDGMASAAKARRGKIVGEAEQVAREMALALADKRAVKAAGRVMQEIGRTFDDAPRLARTSGRNVMSQYQATMAFLERRAATSTGRQKQAAQQLAAGLRAAYRQVEGANRRVAGTFAPVGDAAEISSLRASAAAATFASAWSRIALGAAAAAATAGAALSSIGAAYGRLAAQASRPITFRIGSTGSAPSGGGAGAPQQGVAGGRGGARAQSLDTGGLRSMSLDTPRKIRALETVEEKKKRRAADREARTVASEKKREYKEIVTVDERLAAAAARVDLDARRYRRDSFVEEDAPQIAGVRQRSFAGEAQALLRKAAAGMKASRRASSAGNTGAAKKARARALALMAGVRDLRLSAADAGVDAYGGRLAVITAGGGRRLAGLEAENLRRAAAGTGIDDVTATGRRRDIAQGNLDELRAEQTRLQGAFDKTRKGKQRNIVGRKLRLAREAMEEAASAYGQAAVDAAQAVKDAAEQARATMIQKLDDAIGLAGGRVDLTAGLATETELRQRLAGTDYASITRARDRKGGVFTDDQRAQIRVTRDAINQALQAQVSGLEEQQTAVTGALAAGGLTDSERLGYQRQMQELVNAILGLQVQMRDNTDSAAELTDATTENTTALTQSTGGSVAFGYRGQDYVLGRIGPSSDNLVNADLGA